ncbi:MAG: T9SS type A sorting domain-containing protein [Candidatus Marinimicrobia bacterium]|jgi:spore germination protein YaaH|nr:T9SS type A sorting domain-containing protein [Candidatus Neomarinimicrobiota bacterium]MBT3676292.1 T9SS type A sorting domain-containing protein [Candidatus Neomarinimicrobiota bacterium]MBT3762938.1 T9SS type A sorting domain-containing protein [Candidatus Neomarinimicrobiota bacterium]MBT4269984.1 T9SS type A sorting domain-containing protein [Candidatus Neomarinimicrobiota bacterium]MBT4371318.1 T9SS type A sorting domain-containing protein [Candidatus Neomarinimicrobiota bacterium]
MFKILTIIFALLSLGFSQENFKSIHQIELDYNKANFLEPSYKPKTSPAAPIQYRDQDPSIIVFGYHPYWQGTKWQNYDYDVLTTIAYFSAEANGSGELTNLHGWPVTDLINKAHSNGVEVVLTVSLFNKTDLETLLSSSTNRNNLIKNLIYEVQRGGADGVNLDFEVFPASQKANLVTFVKSLRSSLRDSISHAKVTLATPAVDWSSAWDFNALATESDGLFIMGYDYHWKGSSTTGPVSPLKGGSYNITNTVNTYLSATGNNAAKIILGVPYYGYQWPSNSGDKGAGTTGSGTAVIYSTAESKVLSYGKLWDSASETPWYKYQNNGWFQAWYDDSLSLSKKYDFALSKNLGGIGMWALGYDNDYSQLWDLLKEKTGAKTGPSSPVNISISNMGSGVAAIDFTGSKTASTFQVIRVFLDSSQTEELGTFSSQPILLQNLTTDEPYFLKIKATNEYGNSDFTEVLGVVTSANTPKVLIVNGFDRVSGTDNSFDYIRQHGVAIHNAGYIFDSANNESIINQRVKLNDYSIVDWILGEEGSATSTFTVEEQKLVQNFLKNGGRLFISGSEVGYDLSEKGDFTDQQFYKKYLKAEYFSDAAAGKQGTYSATGVPGTMLENLSINFDDGSYGTYDVDWPDGIQPAGNGEIILKYTDAEYNISGGAGIAFKGSFGGSPIPGGLVYFSFGFETIYPDDKRNEVMAKVLDYLDGAIASTQDEINVIPQKLNISSLYPNPSNRSITIEFHIFEYSPIAYLTITDIIGREIIKLSVQPLATKKQKFTWNGLLPNGLEAPSGMYLANLSQGNKIVTKKFTLLK